MTQQNRIEGIIRLTSPLHCASPDKSLAVQDKNKNEAPTHQQRIVTADGIQKIPYFPGNDLRGRLRRKAASLVLDHLAVRGKVKVELYAGLCAGAISSNLETAELSIEEALRAKNNAYMGLFGGGARLLRSRYRANDLIPVLAETIAAGMVPASYGETSDTNWMPKSANGPARAWEIMESFQVIRINDVMRVMNPSEMEKYVENVVETVAAQQAEVIAQLTKRKADKAAAKAGNIKTSEVAGKKDVGMIVSVQVIQAGTPLYCLLDFMDDASDAHVGMMLLSLQALVREQALGGWVRVGLGRFNADLKLTRNGQTQPVFMADKMGADATISDELQNLYCKPALAALAEMTVDQMMDFFAPRPKAEKNVTDKGEVKEDAAV